MPNRAKTTAHRVWDERLERFRRTHQTVAGFCAAEGVSPASFYQWRRRLGAEAPVAATPARFVPVQLPTALQTEPVTVMSVELPGGVRVKLEVTGTRPEQP
jgi:hypothetical protein